MYYVALGCARTLDGLPRRQKEVDPSSSICIPSPLASLLRLIASLFRLSAPRMLVNQHSSIDFNVKNGIGHIGWEVVNGNPVEEFRANNPHAVTPSSHLSLGRRETVVSVGVVSVGQSSP